MNQEFKFEIWSPPLFCTLTPFGPGADPVDGAREEELCQRTSIVMRHCGVPRSDEMYARNKRAAEGLGIQSPATDKIDC